MLFLLQISIYPYAQKFRLQLSKRVASLCGTYVAEIAREWPEAELSILVENDRLRLSGDLGDAESGEAYSLSGMAADEFLVANLS